jgi:hypothetical protein
MKKSIRLVIGPANCETRTCALGLYDSAGPDKLLAINGRMERSLQEIKQIHKLIFTVDLAIPAVVRAVCDVIKQIPDTDVLVYIPLAKQRREWTKAQQQAVKELASALDQRIHRMCFYRANSAVVSVYGKEPNAAAVVDRKVKGSLGFLIEC